MTMTHDEGPTLLALYDQGGPTDIYEHAKRAHPAWVWEECEPCETDTPTWDGVCAVCWTVRP